VCHRKSMVLLNLLNLLTLLIGFMLLTYFKAGSLITKSRLWSRDRENFGYWVLSCGYTSRSKGACVWSNSVSSPSGASSSQCYKNTESQSSDVREIRGNTLTLRSTCSRQFYLGIRSFGASIKKYPTF
jgi:hypothetical protein